MCVSEICVKRIRVNQGLVVLNKSSFNTKMPVLVVKSAIKCSVGVTFLVRGNFLNQIYSLSG